MKTKYLPLIFLLTFLISCMQEKINFPEESNILGLATPVILNPEETKIHLEDYFMDVSLIDSITIPEYFQSELSQDKKFLTLIIKSGKLPNLMVLKVWDGVSPYSILLKKSRKLSFILTFDPIGKTYQQVSVAGEVNGWNPKESHFELIDDIWQIELSLDPGKYQYQLVLDGKWQLDPNNSDSVDNNMGGFNSFLIVGESVDNILPVLNTHKFEENLIAIKIINKAERIFVFWQNYLIPDDEIIKYDNLITFSIPWEAKKHKRSWIRIWSENRYGVSNDILIPLHKGSVISNAKQLSREDWEASVFYFLMIDRFNNGNNENDFPVEDPEVLPKANYFGGDLVGVTQKINDGYFKDLGINTIWLSPITQNPLGAYGLWPEPKTKFSGYHGYWPISSSNVDFRYGTDNELKELIESAHKQNMNVILDYVANHVHELHPVFLEHPDWATDLYLPDGSLNTEKWDEYRLTTWFDTFLPTLDLSKEEVVEPMTDSALYWIQNFQMDGFRHDATKHIPEVFWRALTRKLKENVSVPQNKRLYQVGETYGNRELINSYVSSGMMNGQFDFGVYDQAVGVFARDNEPFKKLAGSLQESLDYYGYHNLMGYISGNQDKPRFISLAGGDLKFDEDAKLAGWTREIGVGDPKAYKKLQSLNAFNLTIPGIPTIYYGDEFGMPGANDPDNRRMMRFENLSKKEQSTFEIIKKLIHLRRDNIQLIYGDYELLFLDKYTYAFSRTYFDKIAIVLFNKSSKPLPVLVKTPDRIIKDDLQSKFNSNFTIEGNKMQVIVEGNSFEIILN